MQHFSSRAPRLSALVATLTGIVLCGSAQAQTAPILSPVMYFDGTGPVGGLVTDSGGNFYGATSAGSYAPGGLLFTLAANASAVATIYQYGRLDIWTGAHPGAGLMLGSDGNLYGTTQNNSIDTLRGITSGTGTIFRVSVGGQGYTKLFDFDPIIVDIRNYATNDTGFNSQASLIEGIESGVRYLYGTTFQGGQDGTGVIFKIRADGAGVRSGFERLAPFGAAALRAGTTPGTTEFDTNAHGRLKNPNGVNPNQRLLLGGNGYLYGTTTNGGANGTGVVFRVPVAGGAIEVLHQFDAIIPGVTTVDPVTMVSTTTPDTNIEGAYPSAGLTLSGGLLYGTTSGLGINSVGSLFRIALDGTGFTVLRSFNTTDGANPTGDLIITNDGRLAGTTQSGGTLPLDPATGLVVAGTPVGTVYKISLDGATLTQQCVFNSTEAGPKGQNPASGVLQVTEGSFFGTVAGGYGGGLIFKCGSTHSAAVLGVPPPYDDGSGALPWWMIAALTMMLAMQTVRRVRRTR